MKDQSVACLFVTGGLAVALVSCGSEEPTPLDQTPTATSSSVGTTGTTSAEATGPTGMGGGTATAEPGSVSGSSSGFTATSTAQAANSVGGATATAATSSATAATSSATATSVGGATATTSPASTTAGGSGGTGNPGELENFSFFVTSLVAMRQLSGSQDGFGGDLRYGEGDGLTGADKICTEIAEASMPGSGAKQWRAFLSVENGPEGGPVNAIDRIGTGPWYDRLGRIVAMDLQGLLNERPAADPAIAEDLPNELGEPNHTAGGEELDNHDTLTASDENGQLSGGTCGDWTSTEGNGPIVGHSWPAGSGQNWLSAHTVGGCAPSVVDQGSFGSGVGDYGGYGGIYCFALTP